MAKANETPRLQSDPLVDRVVGDPQSPRSNLLLRGFVGTSSKEGFVRLYLDAQFKRRVEIPQETIFAAKAIVNAASPLELTYIWASADAELEWHLSAGKRWITTITEAGCPPQTIHTDCPTPSFNLPCATQSCPAPTDDCPSPSDFCYGGQAHPAVTLACPRSLSSAARHRPSIRIVRLHRSTCHAIPSLVLHRQTTVLRPAIFAMLAEPLGRPPSTAPRLPRWVARRRPSTQIVRHLRTTCPAIPNLVQRRRTTVLRPPTFVPRISAGAIRNSPLRGRVHTVYGPVIGGCGDRPESW
jgi:hypothetical protein